MKRNCNENLYGKLHKEYHLYNQITNDDKLRHKTYKVDTHDIGQFDSKYCDGTCKNNSSKRQQEYFSGPPKQIYAYHKTNFTDIELSSVKTVQKKKVKRIYLPETDSRGVGSSDLSSFFSRKPRYARVNYYDHKKTSSKCVGCERQSTAECVITEQLSPLMRTNCTSTSSKTKDEEKNHIEIGYDAIKRNVITTATQVDTEYVKLKPDEPTQQSPKQIAKGVSNSKLLKKSSREIKSPINKNVTDAAEKVFSSDSLVQHIHNFENPSEDKQSHTSVDPMENELEREYRRMFSVKSKDPKLISERPTPDLKSASLLRWRFEALRRGLAEKANYKNKPKATLISNELNPMTIPSKTDVSIASDPPSLEARSYSFTKAYSSYESLHDQDTGQNTKAVYKKSVANKKERSSLLRSQTGEEADEGVRGMFKLWGEKFDFEQENYKNTSPNLSPTNPPSTKIKPETCVTIKTETESRKGKKFFFFGRKNKDKTKPYKPKKGVTAGRCEVKDGLRIKIGKVNDYSVYETTTEKVPERSKCDNISDEYENILTKDWSKNLLEQIIESKDSVQIRWNNEMYATSSSTVFVTDNVFTQTYNDIEIALKSKSEISTTDSSFCQSFKKQQVRFLQDIEAWMIPKLLPDKPKQLPINVFINNLGQKTAVKINKNDQKCIIDKSRAFAHKIEVVLHSKNFIKRKRDTSSEYLKIHIPEGFFSDSFNISNERGETSNSEEVYKIVEYETPESNTRFRINKGLDTGDFLSNDINVTVSIKDNNFKSKIHEADIKKPILHKDVVIQGSNLCVSRLCDVIGVGIITQRDIREIRKPILKIQYDYSDEESDFEHTLRSNQKTCEFAESYLQDLYQHWIPLGMNVYSWCVSDIHLQCCSDLQTDVNNQDDITKSCPNICDDYQGSTIISSCTTSSCGHCNGIDDRQQQPLKFFSKFKRKNKSEPNQNPFFRVLPKDSFEVFKRRKFYAYSNKSKWFCADDKPYSVPSKEDKCEDTLAKSKIICSEPKKKSCKKHVSMPGCDILNDVLTKELSEQVPGILQFKGAAGCDACKNKDFCAKHSQITKSSPCEIHQPQCKQSGEEKQKPECSKPNQPPRNVPNPPYNFPRTPPDESPSCEIKPCSPSPSPCYKPIYNSPGHTPHPYSSTPPVCPKPPVIPPAILSPYNSLSPPIPMSTSPNCQKPKMRAPPCHTLSPPCPSPPVSPKHSSPPISPKYSPPPVCPKRSPPLACPVPTTPPVSHRPLPLPVYTKPSPTPTCFKPPLHPLPCPHSPPCVSPLPSCLQTQTCASPQSCPCSSCLKPNYLHPPYLLSPRSCRHSPPHCSSPPCFSKSSLPTMKSSCDCSTKKQFWWPMKNQVSNQSSSVSCNISPQEKSLQATPGYSQMDCQTQESQIHVKPCPKPQIGIYLKKEALSQPQKNLGSCPPPNNECTVTSLPPRLPNKNLRIRVNKATPNTEEIREGLNIKVQDADGRTLYERKDYTTHSSLIGEMYNVHRVSTPRVQNVQLDETNNVEEMKSSSETSIANQIQIHFKLNLTPGNKTKEMEIDNKGEIKLEIPEIQNETRQTQDVFVVKDDDESIVENSNGKNDINIKIVIKNFRPKSKKEKVSEDYAKKISDKFHSVSTRYSEVDQIFSLHETNIKHKSSEEIMIQEFTDKPTTSTETMHDTVTNKELTEDTKLGKSQLIINEIKGRILNTGHMTKCNTQIQSNTEEIQEQKSKAPVYVNNEEQHENNLEINSDELNNFNSTDDIPRLRTRQEKKDMLKKVFEKAGNMEKGKCRNRRNILKAMLETILTSDSSDREEIKAASTDLAKDITYASLTPNYFRDTDSMNNYYKNDVVSNSDDQRKVKLTYSTEEYIKGNRQCDLSEPPRSPRNCVCSTFAKKLNLSKTIDGGCCCCSVASPKVNEETNCDLRNGIDSSSLNYKAPENCNVQIRNSIKNNKVNELSIAKVKSCKMTKVMDDMSKESHKRDNDEINGVENKILTRTFSPRVGHVKECAIRTLNKKTMLGVSNEDEIYELNTSSNKNEEKRIRRKETVFFAKTADILQSYETKKAVLEIYAEKTFSQGREHIVAKLPKFVNDMGEIERI